MNMLAVMDNRYSTNISSYRHPFKSSAIMVVVIVIIIGYYYH